MHREYSDFILINGNPIPCPAPGYEIVSARNVNAGRNANGEVIGQLVGRKIWKINNLQWNGIDADDWTYIQNLLEPFFVTVTFTNDKNERKTLTMYPGDSTGQPLFLNDVSYKNYVSCKVNLIDCGYLNEG